MSHMRNNDGVLLEPAVAPPVVAVIVTCDPGPWLEEALTAFAAQDYPNLAVLVIDAASAEDPLLRIAQILPSAYVRRLSRNPGYSAATNRALRIVQGASHLVLCHDDVAPAPDAIRLLMEEALQSNAGIVAPKSVHWDQPDLLLHMGATVDLTGAIVPALEAGDLDQGQHDIPGEVFVTPGGFLLVRSDLFKALGGFDPAMTVLGEDVDLCWRARLAGAQVRTAPSARVRHLQALTNSQRGIDLQPVAGSDEEPDLTVAPSFDPMTLAKRHRLRTVLKATMGRALPLVVVRQLLLNVAEILYALVTGERRRVTAVLAAWTWNLVHWRSLISLRRQTQKRRTVSDDFLNARMGSLRGRLSERVRTDWHERRATVFNERHGREIAKSLKRVSVIVWTLLALTWLIGSRSLITGDLPTLSRFVDLDHNPFASFARYLGLYPGKGFGEVVTASPSHLIEGLAQLVTLGATGSLVKILALILVPLGVLGAARLTKPLQSKRARLSSAVAYAAAPLAYDSVAFGRLDALLCYAMAPWVLGRIARSAGQFPYSSKRGYLPLPSRRRPDQEEELEAVVVGADPSDRSPATLSVEGLDPATILDEPSTSKAQAFWFLYVRRALPLALLVAVAGAFAPQFVTAFVVAGLAYLAGGFIAGDAYNWRRTAVTMASAGATVLLLLLPQMLGSDAGLLAFTTLAPTAVQPDGLGELLRFSGTTTAAFLTFALLVAAAPALIFGREWRLRMAVRLWSVFVISVLLLWMSKRGWLGPLELDVLSFLPLAAAATALAVGISTIALRDDFVPAYDWQRRVLVPLSFFAAVIAFLPIFPRTFDGRWGLPDLPLTTLLGFVPDSSANGSFRTLYLGDASTLPGAPRRLSSDLAGTFTTNGVEVTSPSLPDEGGVGQERVAQAISDARKGETVLLGRLLAPYSVRYIIVPKSTGVTSNSNLSLGGYDAPPPPDLLPALARQLDLRPIDAVSSLEVFENTNWVPINSALSAGLAGAADASAPPTAGAFPLEGNVPVLTEQASDRRWLGEVPAGPLYVGRASEDAWRLTVDGRSVERQSAFGWANLFSVPGAGDGVLQFVPPAWVRLFQLFNLACWAAACWLAFRHRNRRGRFA